MNFQLLVTLFRTILNSSVFAGFYFGVLTLFSIRPSYLFLFVEEPEKKLAAISGVILGQFVRFLSIYNATLHRLLCIPHAITAFFLPYLVISFLVDNFHPSYSISTSSTFSFFLNSFLFQLSNQIIFPSSLSARVGHIYLFRCKNKLDFLTGSFVGWSIAQICLLLFLHRLFALLYKYRLRSAQNQLVSKWIKFITKYLGEGFPAFLAQGVSYYNTYSNKIYQYLAKHLGNDFTDLARDCEWFVSEVQYLVLIELPRNTGRVITLLLYFFFALYATRLPVATMSKNQESSVERTFEPSDLTRQLEKAYSFLGFETTSIQKSTRKRVKKESKEYTEDLPVWGVDRRYVDRNEVEGELIKPDEVPIEDSALAFFEPNRWNRPLRYIRNQLFMGAVEEHRISQHFFTTCGSDGKERLAFTYLPALSFFKKMMKRIGISSSKVKVARPSFDKLDKNWIKNNKKKKKNLNNELKKRIEALDTGFLFRDILDKRTRVCTDQTLKTCLPIRSDPLLNGPHRVRIKELDSSLDLDFGTSEVPTIQIAPSHRDRLGETTKLLDPLLDPIEKFDVRDLTETISLLPEEAEKSQPTDQTSQPTDQRSQPSQLGQIPQLASENPEDPVITFMEYSLDSAEVAFKKIDQPRRRKKISKRLYSQFLEYQARRKKNRETGKSQAPRIKNRKTVKSQAPRKKNRKTVKSHEREIIQPNIRKMFEINRLIDTILPGCVPLSPKYGLRTYGVRERKKRLAKSKLFSNPLAKLFQRLAKSKLFSNPWGSVDSEKQKTILELENYAKKQQKHLDKEIWKEVPRWKWLFITELQKELNVDTLTAPRRKDDSKENDYEISSYKMKEIYITNMQVTSKNKRMRKKKETEEDENSEKTDTQIDENSEKTDTQIDENSEKTDTQIDENSEKTDTQIDENSEKIDTQIDENSEKIDTQIDENSEKTDSKIDEKNKKTDTKIDEKTQKKKKTQAEIQEEIAKEILNKDQIWKKMKEKEEDETFKVEFSNWARHRANLLQGSTRPLERKRLFLRWVEPFSHSPLFYRFTTSRLDIYFKLKQVKAFVKKGIDTFKILIRKIRKKGPLEKTKRKIDEKERKESKERKEREESKERKEREEREERKERKERDKWKERKKGIETDKWKERKKGTIDPQVKKLIRKIREKRPLEKPKRKIDEKERKERKKRKKIKELIERNRLIINIIKPAIKILKLLKLRPLRKKKQMIKETRTEQLPPDVQEEIQWAAIDAWETHIDNGLGVRTCFLVFQAILRKFVRLPLLIIVKNIFRFLFFQKPEWSEDFEDWQNEVHVLSDNLGNILSEGIWAKKWPEYWFEDGFQIKVLRPFSLKAWHTLYDAEINPPDHDYLFIRPFTWGLGSFAFSEESVDERAFELFFSPIWNALNPIRKIAHIIYRFFVRRLKILFFLIRKCIKVLRKCIKVLRKDTKFLLNCIISCVKTCNKVLRTFVKTTIQKMEIFRKQMKTKMGRFRKKMGIVRRVDESSETKKEKDSIISNERIQESFSEIQSTFEEEIQNIMDRTNTINNEIEILRKEKIKVTPGLNKNGESPKNLWKMFKRRKVRLINKFHYFQNCLIEKIYQICLDILLSISNERITEKTKKKRIVLTNNFMKFFVSPDLSSLSQAYVFYKLSQSQLSDKLRSVLQYRGTSFFLKTEIKESFERQGIFHSELKNKTELKNKKLRNFRTNPWKNWLRGHSHYTLSKRRWSELKDDLKWSKLKAQLPKKKEQNGPKKKEQNGPKKKEQNVKKQKNKLEKTYRYDLLAYKFLSSETKKDSYIAKQKDELCGIPEGMFIKYYLNYPDRGLMPSGGVPVHIFEEDVLDAIDTWIETWDGTNDILFGPYPVSSISGVIPIEIEKPSIKPPTKKTRENDIIDDLLDWIRMNQDFFLNSMGNWMGMNEDLHGDARVVNSRNEDWFVRHVMKPAEVYNEKPWIKPRELLFRNLPVQRELVSAEELKQFKKEKAEQKEKEKKEKIKAPPILNPKLLILRDPLQNEKQEQEGDNLQEAFTNVYDKMLREKEEELLSERTGNKEDFLVYWTDFDIFRFHCPGQRRLDTVFRESKLPFRKRKMLFNYWKLGYATVDNMICAGHREAYHQRWIEKGALVHKYYPHAFMNNQEKLIMYQALSIALLHKMKLETKQNFDLLVPEMILSSRRRRELRILNSLNFNFKNRNDVDINRVFCKANNIKSWGQFLDESKDLDREKNEFIKFKFFLWPNFRLEDLACMNRYWFDTSNGSRFSMLRIYMYPRFKMRWW